MNPELKFFAFIVCVLAFMAALAVGIVALVNWGRSHAYASCISTSGNTVDCFEYAYDVKRERHDFTLNLGLKK